MLQFLTDAEGHPFDRKHVLVKRGPDLRIPAGSQVCPMLPIKSGVCKSAVVLKPFGHIHMPATPTLTS